MTPVAAVVGTVGVVAVSASDEAPVLQADTAMPSRRTARNGSITEKGLGSHMDSGGEERGETRSDA